MDPPAMLRSPLDPPEKALGMQFKTYAPRARPRTPSPVVEKLLQGQRRGVDPPAAVHSARRRSSKSSKSKTKPTSQSKDTDQNEFVTCPLFLRKIAKLIDEEEWRELDSFLQLSADATARHLLAPTSTHETSEGNDCNDDIPGVIQSVEELRDSTEIYTHTQICNMNIVHYACRFNPPRSILRRLFALYPEGATRPDVLGRLPLHHAAKCSASESLINYLINKDPSSASISDAHGKTPLIHLCENYSSTTENSEACSMMEATRALIKAAPGTVNLKDSTGTNALEYAIMSNSPHDVVTYIQAKSARDWRNRKKTSTPGKDTHNLIEEELVREHQKKQRAQDQLQKRETCARTA